jgi:RHS repeat-associated protein
LATIEYTYNPAGKVINRTDQRGIVTTYEYDDIYNMTQTSVFSGGISTIESFSYDGLGRMLTADKYDGANFISESVFAYNSVGKITDIWETILDASQQHIHYSYDNAGNRTQTVYPDGSAIDRTNTWDGLIDILSQNGDSLVEYDYAGSRSVRRYYPAPNVATDTLYDNIGRIQSIDAGSGYISFDFGYAANSNNIERITFDHRAGDPYNQYGYDNLDRLTQADYLVGFLSENEVFGMDDLGNRTTVNLRSGFDQIYDVNDLTNRYASIDQAGLQYDAAGNLLVDQNGYHYEYDYENRITCIYRFDGPMQVDIARYTYDALGRRIEFISYYEGDIDVIRRHLYNDQWQILTLELEWPGYDPIHRNYLHGNYIDEVLAFEWVVGGQSGQRNYFLHDHLYTPVAMIGSNGSVSERYEYDAYGKRTVMTSGYVPRSYSLFANDFGLTGRELDELDLDAANSARLLHMHYRHRSFSPLLGGFLQQDLLGTRPVFKNLRQIATSKQYQDGLSLYQYVSSKPITSLDPKGQSIWYCTTDSDFGVGKHAYIYDDSYGDNMDDLWPGLGDGSGGQSCGMNGSSGGPIADNNCNGFPDGCRKGPSEGDGSPWNPDKEETGGKNTTCQRIGGTDDPDTSLCVMAACYNDINSWPIWFPWVHDCHNGVQDSLSECGVDMVDDNGTPIPTDRL